MTDHDSDTLDADDSEDSAPLTLEAWAARSLRAHDTAHTSLELICEAYSEATGEPEPEPSEALDTLSTLYTIHYHDTAGRYSVAAVLRH